MRHGALRACGLTVGLFVSSTPAAAQIVPVDPLRPFLGRSVGAVRIEVEEQTAPAQELLPLVDVKPGQLLRRVDLQASIKRLGSRELGRFDAVTVAVDGAEPLTVIFRLTPRHPVVDLIVQGATGIPAGDLRQLVIDRYRGVPTAERVSAIEDAVENLLRERGYPAASVRGRTTERHAPHQAVLVLDVTAGAVDLVGSVTVTGISPLPNEEIVRRAGAAENSPLRPRELQTRMAAIGADLRAQGYYEAVSSYSFEVGLDGRIALTLVVNAGPLVFLTFTGDALPPGSPDELVPIERERSADPDLLLDARRRIEAGLQALGYRDARAPYERDESADRTRLVIRYTITRGPLYRVGEVRWPEGLGLTPVELNVVFEVRPGDPYSAAAVNRGLGRVRQLYRALGYYNVQLGHEVDPLDGSAGATERTLRLRPLVGEGPRGTVRQVTFVFAGPHDVPEDALRRAMELQEGEAFVAAFLPSDADAIEREYHNRGYRAAQVRLATELSADGRDIRVTVQVTEGPRVLVGDIVVVGNRDISADAVLEEITLRPGEPFSLSREEESLTRLRELGIFRSVTIVSPQVLPGETRATLIVSVEELPNFSAGFGGGFEVDRRPRTEGLEILDRLQFAPRGFVEVTRRNLGGRNRSLSLFGRLALQPRTVDVPNSDGHLFGFSEYKVTTTFQEQRVFGTDASALISLQSEQAIRTSYNFVRQTGSAEAVRQLSPKLTLSGRYALQTTRLFDEAIPEGEQLEVDRLFPQVLLSSFSSSFQWDRRNRVLSPTSGMLTSGDVEVAMRAIGSEVGYAKTVLNVSVFRAVTPGTNRSVFAARARFGAARGFDRAVTSDLPASQRFFAGGGSSVRGFQTDRLGAAEVISDNGLPLGGNAMVVLNAELRTAVRTILGRPLTLVGFADGGNVFARAEDVSLARLRGAVGFGVRYDSPLGPLRLDFGFKLDRRIVGGQRERRWEYHLSIGEIF